MKSYHLMHKGAGLAGLTVKEHDIPVPGPNAVLMRVRASAFNYRELLIMRGTYPLAIKPDGIQLCDGAGEIVATGPGVTRAKIGDRVAVNTIVKWIDGHFGGWDPTAHIPEWIDGPSGGFHFASQIGGTLDGLLTEYALLNEETILHIPDHLSFEEAATLPTAALTAWNALVGGSRPLQAGETVLTRGSGGVALFALQLAKLFGARVIMTTSSDEKAERLKALGADDVVTNYQTTPSWHEEVRKLMGERGVDHVVETTSPGTFEQSMKTLAPDGQITLVGWLPSDVAKIDYATIGMNLATLRGIYAGSRAHFSAMNRAIAQGRLRPVVDRVFPFEDAKAAYRYYEEAQPFGKIVISQN